MEKTTPRYLALDVLRGMTIAMMITVNNPGSWSYVYAPLSHSHWHGCTPTDLVFPFFLFVVGVSMFFSFSKYGQTLNRESLIRLGKRTLLIFAIGLFFNSFPQWSRDFSRLRIMGVLQRIAVAYCLSSLIVLSVRKKYLPWIGAVILLAYWWILCHFGTGDPYSLETNATIPFDRAVLGGNHLYRGFGIPFDPEGLLSTLPAVVTPIIGYLAGSLIRESRREKVPLRLALAGVAGMIAGIIWGQFFPINKPLWTSSYVLYTAGWASLVLGFLIWIIDLQGYKKWTTFFVVFGKNPLFIFALSDFWAITLIRIIRFPGPDGEMMNGYTWIYQHLFVPIAGEMNGSLLFALTHVLFFWLIGYLLYRKKIFIKV